jgi:hypothetical protein
MRRVPNNPPSDRIATDQDGGRIAITIRKRERIG